MLPDELRLFADRHVPGAGPVEIQRSGGGLVNETYRVLRDGATYAMRVAAANLYALGVDRDWEAQVLKARARRISHPLWSTSMHGAEF
jgi:aminoglycoside phosphotransferase (APT) family kinase protein